MAQRAAHGSWLRCGLVCLVILLLNVPTARAAPLPALQFQMFARTGLPLGDILWTGTAFLYDSEGHPEIQAGDASGHGLRLFARVPRNTGEMRCVLSSGAHGFTAGAIYCHTANRQIYRISSDGHSVTLLASLPPGRVTDGSLTFDSGGAFDGALLAATGGSDSGPGGVVYAITAQGKVRAIGAYAGPGGAENIAMAPPGFGASTGQVLLAVDKHDHQGRLLAMDAHGHVRTLVQRLFHGLNPIVPLTAAPTGTPQKGTPGLYLADWASHDVFVAPATQFAGFEGDVVVATELGGLVYLVQPRGSGYNATPLRTNLHAPHYNFESATYIGG